MAAVVVGAPYDDAMALRDVKEADVIQAIQLLDDPVRGGELLTSLNYHPARTYRLIHRGRFYDSKAVVGIAHGVTSGDYLTSDQLVGGVNGNAASVLEGRGFFVDHGLLHGIGKLPVDHSHDDLPRMNTSYLCGRSRARSPATRA